MKEMIIKDRRLLLSDKDPRHGLSLPIDLFLRSLAQDVGERAIAVILSGSGSDGSRGIQEISRAGGVVFCESPDTAQFNGMPVSAMHTGIVDQVLPPEEIARAVAALGRPQPAMRDGGGRPGADDQGADAILRLLRDEYGIDFSHYKASTVTRRIERRLALNRSLDLEMYVEQLRSDPRELNSLYEDLLIGVTRFFRDDAAFTTLEQRIVPELVERTAAGEQIRVWVPGCATGQEAVFHRHAAARTAGRGSEGRQREDSRHRCSQDVPRSRQRRDLLGAADRRHHAGASRSVLHAQTAGLPDLADAAREHRLRAAQPHPRRAVHETRSDHLPESADLLPAARATDRPDALPFLFEARRRCSFSDRARRQARCSTNSTRSTSTGRCTGNGGISHCRAISNCRCREAPPRHAGRRPSLVRGGGVQPQLLALYDRLLDRFMPPSFLVDEHGQLVDTFGGVASLLTVKARRPSPHLVDMLSDDLKTVVSSALHRVQRDGEHVRYADVPMRRRAHA